MNRSVINPFRQVSLIGLALLSCLRLSAQMGGRQSSSNPKRKRRYRHPAGLARQLQRVMPGYASLPGQREL